MQPPGAIMKRNFLPLALALIAAGFLGATDARAEPVVAGHPALAGTTLDAEAIKAVLLGKRVTLGDTRVVIVIARTGEAQENFLRTHLGMTASQFQNHWRRLFMTGGGSVPKIVETQADAIKLAAATPGAIVLTDSSTVAALVVLAAN